MKLTEKINIITDYYPFAESLNKRLICDCKDIDFIRNLRTYDGKESNVKALRSGWKTTSPNIKKVSEWVITLIRNQLHKTHPYKCIETWLARYNEGDYTIDHDHRLTWYSFVYFVKFPKGASPLVFTTSGKEIKPEEGRVVIFPSIIRHHVPKNKCNDRIVLAGNIV